MSSIVILDSGKSVFVRSRVIFMAFCSSSNCGMPAPTSNGLVRLFESRRKALDRARVARAGVTGLCLGLTFGAAVSAGLLVVGPADWRPVGFLVAAVGAALGAASGLRRRLTTEDVAVFFDARLQGKSEISTALAPADLRGTDPGVLSLPSGRRHDIGSP